MLLENIAIYLGFTAGAVQLVGYLAYNKLAGEEINAGSWLMWAIGGAFELISYGALTYQDHHVDWAKIALPIVCAIAALLFYFHSLLKKRFGEIERGDWYFLTIDIGLAVAWLALSTFSLTTVIVNLLYQATAAISFQPMIRNVKAGKEKEHPFPWLLWTIAYALLGISVAISIRDWLNVREVAELAYPITYFLLHIQILLLSRKKLSAIN